METLSKTFKSNALEIIQFEKRHTGSIFWNFLHVRLINIPIYEHSQKLFYLRLIQKDFAVNSQLDRRIHKCGFRDGRVGKSR